jgi:uncharacterized protein (TIRG00374 family)
MNLIKQILKIVLPVLFAGVMLWYVFQKVDFNEIIHKLAETNYYWVSLAISISILSHVFRALRWGLMLRPLGYKANRFNLFNAVMTGYFANIFLPRAGELLRCVSLNRTDNIPSNESFGTVIAERAIDFICLLVLIFFSFLLEYDRFLIFFQENVFNKKAGSQISFDYTLLIYVGIVLVLIAIAIIYYWKKITQSALAQKIIAFVYGVFQGILSIRKMENKFMFILQTIAIWFCYYLMTYLMFFALPSTSHLGPLAGLVILIVGGLGMSAPVSGGIGPFHLMVAGALQLFYGLNQADGIAYAFVIHTSQMAMVVVIGGVLTIRSMLLIKPINQ